MGGKTMDDAMEHGRKMNPGERQVAPTLEGIRRDHIARYQFAAQRLRELSVIDVGCGVGYGAKLLAAAGRCRVKAADRDEVAIQYARQHYADEKVTYVVADADNLGPFAAMDAAVAFEVIEHLEDPLPMLRRLARYCERLICSVPNELVFPYRNYKYHYRHYTPEQFCHLLADAGWGVDEWWGQAGPESDLERDTQGRTVVAVCAKSGLPDRDAWKRLPAVAPPGVGKVAIVAMGKSAGTYLNLCAALGDRHRVADQTWAINSMGGAIQHDLLIHMDDCKVQEARAAAQPNGNVAGMVRWLKQHPRFYTSRVYDDYPGAMEYPLQDVVDNIGTTYLNNTVAYAVALAIKERASHIALHGCDYSYQDLHKAERGRGCVEFLLGLAAARGIAIEVAGDSSLLDANVKDGMRLYGYDAYDVRFEREKNGRLIVRKDLRKTLPSAAEMEQRYCYEAPRAPAKPKQEEVA